MYEYIGIIGWIVAIVCIACGVVVVWGLKDDEDSKPDGVVSTGPKCYGTFPMFDSESLVKRQCMTCIYKNQCFDRTQR